MAHIPTKPIINQTGDFNYNKLINPTGLEGQSSFNVQTMRQLWGNLWSSDPNNSTSSALDDLEYKQSLDMYSAYKDRYLPIHSNLITAAIRNSRNDFLITVVAPIFETNEINFRMTQNEWNQIAFDDLQEGGIANEPTYTSWQWTDTTRRARQDVTISRDLAMDDNYGESTFREHFAELSANTLLTLYKNVAYSLVSVGYQNMVQDRTVNLPFDLSRLYAAEAQSFLAFAVDPDDAFQIIHEMERVVDGLDLVIVPENASRFMTNKNNTPRNLPTRILTYDEPSRSFRSPDDLPGPKTFRSYSFGDRWIDVMEMRSFTVNSLDRRAENPLCAKLTLCQFFPPNPDVKHSDMIRHTSPELLDSWIFYQTKDKGENQRLAFKDSLANCFYWDRKTGEISNEIKTFIDMLNERNHGNRNGAPWQFSGSWSSGDINEDIGSYDNPSYDAMTQMSTSPSILEMKSMRHKFVAAVWDSSRNEYHWPEYIGDNHLDALPREWILRAVRSLAIKFEEVTGQNINNGLSELFSLLDNIKSAPVTRDYIEDLINANMSELTRVTSTAGRTLTEFPVNVHGSLRLPTNESGALSGMKYTNGFHSGPGLLTIRDQEHKPGTTFYEMAMEAKRVLMFVDTLINFIRTYIGQSEVIDPSLAAPWFQFDAETKSKDAVIATFIDALYASEGELEGPVFLGVPVKALGQKNVVPVPSKPKTNSDTLMTYLRDTNLNAIDLSKPPIAPVNDAIRALSRLSIVTAQIFKSFILNEEYAEISSGLFKLVIILTTSKTEEGRKNANAIVQKFYTIMAPNFIVDGIVPTKPTNTKEANDFIKRVSGKGGLAKDAADLSKLDASLDSSKSFEDDLDAYERRDVSPSTIDPGFSQKDRKKDLETRGEARGDVAALFFDGLYDGNPSTYMRSALISSPALVEFIRSTGNQWALPADKNSLYTTADFSVPTGNAGDRGRSGGMGYSSLFSLSGAHVALNAGPSSHESTVDDEEDYFGAKSTGRQQRGLSSNSLFSFGANSSSAFPGDSRFKHGKADLPQKVKGGVKGLKGREEAIRSRYIGPWSAHLKFCDEQISDRFHRIMYRTLIQTKNTRDVHWRLADIGAQLINVIHFRPFIEFYASSAVVMKKGEDTCASPISRFDAYITKEHRGYFHIGCTFHYGFIRRHPEHIRLIPYCFPDRFVSGKKLDFMTHQDQWQPRNPLKPSIIALPTPISERRYRSPVHMMNRKSISRPDIDGPEWERKYSSWEFYEHIFGTDRVNGVDEIHMERFRYCDSVCASHVAYEGPRYYKDRSTLEFVEYDGVGPGNKWCMNTNGAQDTWNGTQTLFPSTTPNINTRARGTV